MQFYNQLGMMGVAGGIPMANMVGWYQADIGITKDGSNRISQWDDQSGNGNHLVQATGANQPLHDSTQQLNGIDAVYMAGTQTFAEFMTCTGSIDYNSTIFIVATLDYDGGSHDSYTLISANNGGSGTRLMEFQTLTGGNGNYKGRDLSTGQNHQVTGPDTIPVGGTAFQYTANLNPPSSSVIRLDGVGQSKSESGTLNVSSISNWIMGKNPTANIGYDGCIYEIIIYNGNVTGTDLTDVESYLTTKYAL